MELNGNITPGASLEGSFDFDSGDYNNLKNKPSINGVTLEGNKTSSDLHIDTGGGGGGGTTDYDQLDNKPAINGHTLTGDQTAEDLDIITGYPVELPTPTDPSKYLDGSGNWSTPTISGNFIITNIWNYINDNSGVIPYDAFGTKTLNDNINNYDAVVLELVSQADDLNNQWRGTVITPTYYVDILNNQIEPGAINVTTYGNRSSHYIISGNTINASASAGGTINGLVNVYGITY